MQTQQPEMSDFELPPKPDPKEPVSVRMPASMKAKIQWVMELWRETARAKGAGDDTIESIDFPFVHLRLLGGRTDEELQQWGGFPETEAQRQAQLKAVREAAKAQSNTSPKKR